MQYRILLGALGMAMYVNLQDAKVYMSEAIIITWFRAKLVTIIMLLSLMHEIDTFNRQVMSLRHARKISNGHGKKEVSKIRRGMGIRKMVPCRKWKKLWEYQ